MPHTPVLLKEIIEILNPQPGPAGLKGKFFIDGTIGSAGHSEEILKLIGPKGKLLGIDWDEKNIEYCKKKIRNFLNVTLIHGNYRDLPEIIKNKKLGKADGLIIDLGFSSEQIDSIPENDRSFEQGVRQSLGRGFSFQKNEPLDMRYDAAGDITARDVINKYNEKELADIFWKYGEERYSRRIAKKIIEERKRKSIETTFELVEIIKKSVPRNYKRGRIHPATKVFQALRIYVNQELENLEELLKNLDKIVKNKGRAAIISFHSLEDRLVKNYFREMAKQGKAEILTKKPIRPSEEEIMANPRSRSAKLRAINIY